MEKLVNMLETLEQVYKGKKVFLTGHTGFKGAWMLKILSILGAKIKGYALAPENEVDLYNVLNGDSLCHSVIGDLRDRQKLTSEILAFQPDFIFHLAAQPLVRLSYQIPSETFEVNAIGTANLLDGIKLLEKACNVVLITTDKVYHNYEWPYPYRENDRLGGYDPYSASKACAELVIDSYRNSFFNVTRYSEHQKAIAVGRAGNVIGGGDWAKDRLIPDIIRALSKGDKVEIRNPLSVRPWQHVLEPLFGYILLGSKLINDARHFSQAFNFGPYFNDALPVKDMVNLSIRSWGSGEYYINQRSDQVHEAGLLKLDISKAISEIGWTPKLNASKALEFTVNWYKEFHARPNNIVKYTETQISQYIAL